MADKWFHGSPPPTHTPHHTTHPNPSTLQSAAPAELVCAPCGGRVFKDRAALEQHTRAKHVGIFQDLKPDWAQAQAQAEGKGEKKKGDGEGEQQKPSLSKEQLRFKGKDAAAYAALQASDPAAAATYRLCEVCAYHVPVGVDHLGDLRPPELPTFRCLGCERSFHEERALKQHANACKAFLVQLRRQEQQEQQEAPQGTGKKEEAAVAVAAEA